jgi:hypothetical protein
MLYSNEITGVVCIAVVMLPRFITNDMQKGISEKSRSIGWFQFAVLVMTLSIVDTLNVSKFC